MLWSWLTSLAGLAIPQTWGILGSGATVSLPALQAETAIGLGRLIDAWHAALTVRAMGDRNRYRSRVKFIAETCGWVVIEQATPDSIDPWLTLVAERGDSPSSVNNALSALATFFEWTKQRTGKPAVNWARGVSRPPNIKGAGSRACTSAELVRLVAAARRAIQTDPRQKRSTRDRQYVVSAYAGLRASELLRLRVGWLDLQSDPPRLELPAGARKARKTKTRTMLLHPETLDALIPLCQGKTPDSPIFPGAVDPESFRRDLERAGIDEVDRRGRVLTFHGLRKTFGTQLARFGVGQRAAQALLDHSDANTTARIYQDADLLPLFLELCKVPKMCDLFGGQLGGGEEKAKKDLTDPRGMGDTTPGATGQPPSRSNPVPCRAVRGPVAPQPHAEPRHGTGDRENRASHEGLATERAPVGVESTGDLESLLIAALRCGIEAFAGALRNGAASGRQQAPSS